MGRESPSRGHPILSRALEQSASQLLDALDTGLLLLTRDLCVNYANARWEQWMGAPIGAATPFVSLLEENGALAQDDLRAVLMDGEERMLQLQLRAPRADATVRRIACCARRNGDGLLLEARAESDDDRSGMHDVARRLGEVTDMAEVLRTLCDIAARQCGGTGSAVLRITGEMGEVVAAVGDMIPAKGRCFELGGSLASEALRSGSLASEENFTNSGRPLMRSVPELSLGPVLVSPLRAHGDTLGVLVVVRATGGRSFRERERERLRLLADHAALAVHKSQLLAQAQSADRAKGRFLATMSHELRTPLTALAGYGELLADQVIGPMSDSQLDILERMRSVTTHLSAMIEEILAFTSLEEGREQVRPSEFLAEDLVRAAVAVVEPLAGHKGLALDTRLPRTSVRMTGDIDKARQILVNLLGNAVKFTEAGSVSIKLSRGPRWARFDVVDTGIGIETDELPRLFKPFAQVDTGLTRRHGGTGLGLYISRRLATLLGGHVEVESHAGKGSRFSVVLPLVWEQLPERRPVSASATPRSAERR